MEVVNVSGLKNNPSEALRKAREDLVLVMNRNQPDAVLVHLDEDQTLSLPGVRLALATALFRDGNLPLGRAARLAQLSLPGFIEHLGRLGVAAVNGDSKEAERDMETLDQWLASS